MSEPTPTPPTQIAVQIVPVVDPGRAPRLATHFFCTRLNGLYILDVAAVDARELHLTLQAAKAGKPAQDIPAFINDRFVMDEDGLERLAEVVAEIKAKRAVQLAGATQG